MLAWTLVAAITWRQTLHLPRPLKACHPAWVSREIVCADTAGQWTTDPSMKDADPPPMISTRKVRLLLGQIDVAAQFTQS